MQCFEGRFTFRGWKAERGNPARFNTCDQRYRTIMGTLPGFDERTLRACSIVFLSLIPGVRC
jgi:hypothetical protein